MQLKGLRRRNLPLTINRRRGKGGHISLMLGAKMVIAPTGHKELKAGTLAAILKVLGLTKVDL